jgi:hypothetical protein
VKEKQARRPISLLRCSQGHGAGGVRFLHLVTMASATRVDFVVAQCPTLARLEVIPLEEFGRSLQVILGYVAESWEIESERNQVKSRFEQGSRGEAPMPPS